MSTPLRALVLGAGFAGQGHTQSFRRAGVEVVGIAGLASPALTEVANRMEIPHHGEDWRQMLRDLQPDIVVVATPGGVHLEQCCAALEAGCHVLCEKPLATSAEEARQIYALAKRQGVKTAFAASFRYQPQVRFARELVASGAIGQVYEAECVSHYNWPRYMPFGWPHQLNLGGGRLNNCFTHQLGMVQQVVGGEVLAVMGEARNDLRRTPIGDTVHDFREFRQHALSEDALAEVEWATVDSDWSFTVLARLGERAAGIEAAVSATFRHSGLRFSKTPDYLAFYGEEGAIHIDGGYAQGAVYLGKAAGEWEELPLPVHLRREERADETDTHRNWDLLDGEFVADIRGEGYSSYFTFREGWLFQEVIDIVRRGDGWTNVADDLYAGM